MKKISTLTLLLIVFGCQTSLNEENKKIDSSSTTAAADRMADSILAVQATNFDSINKKSIDSLLKKFSIEKDEFRDLKFYTPKRFSGKYWPNRTTIYSYINSNGTIFLVSNFYSDDWIFHDRVRVLIDGNAYPSSSVPTYDKNNATDNSSGSVWENVTHSEGIDKLIIEQIAENYNKVIQVRFEGRQYYHDITLSSLDKEAIRDTWKLYKLKFGNY